MGRPQVVNNFAVNWGGLDPPTQVRQFWVSQLFFQAAMYLKRDK